MPHLASVGNQTAVTPRRYSLSYQERGDYRYVQINLLKQALKLESVQPTISPVRDSLEDSRPTSTQRVQVCSFLSKSAMERMPNHKFRRTCELSPSQARAIRQCGFAYFAGIMVPSAGEQKFLRVCDWGYWIFLYDDFFDNGTMRDDPDRAATLMESLLSTFHDGSNEERQRDCDKEAINHILRFHDELWRSIRSSSSQGKRRTDLITVPRLRETGIARRYAAAMEQYGVGALTQVQQMTLSETPGIEEVLSQRRQSVCVLSLFALVEFAHDIDLPDEFHNHPTIQYIQALAVDITLLHNDLLSYHKEQSEDVPHNVLAAFIESGVAAQEAVDLIGAAIDRRLLNLEQAIEKMANWKMPWQNQCIRYLQGIRDVIKANLYWSFHSDRFLSEDQKTRLMTTGMLDIPTPWTYADSGDLTHERQQTLSSPYEPYEWPMLQTTTRQGISTDTLNNNTITPIDLVVCM
jgi:hypothetical protein